VGNTAGHPEVELAAKIGARSKYVSHQQGGASADSIVEHPNNDPLAHGHGLDQPGSFPCMETLTREKGEFRNSRALRGKLIKVAIVDDSDKTRILLQEILEQSGEYECVGSYPSGERAIYEVPLASPAIVLMDIRLPGMSGIECTRRLKAMLPGLSVILVSVLADWDSISAARKAGGDYYLKKPFSIDQCLIALRFMLDRNCLGTGDNSAGDSLFSKGEREDGRLTKRQNQVMSCLAKGLFDKEIAEELGISIPTVRFHLHSAYHKLSAGNRIEAVNSWREVIGPQTGLSLS